MNADHRLHVGAPSERRRAREFALHSAALGLILWSVVLLDSCSLTPIGRLSHAVKARDFLQFYTLGAVARERQYDALTSWPLFHREQARLVPPAAGVNYPPVYGPQVALLFVPASLVPFAHAYAAWAAFTILLALAAVACLLSCTRVVRRYPLQAVATMLAYPPFAYSVLAGQISVVALVALALFALALARGWKWAAGAALGLLGYKATLLLPAVAICLLAGEWLLALSAGCVGLGQLGAAIPFVGVGPVAGFARNLVGFARQPDLLANPYLMTSLRTFWLMLLPGGVGQIVYLVTASCTILLVAWGWRRTSAPLDRAALLSLGTCLATPHLYLYDLLCLAPAFLYLADRLLESPRQAGPYLRVCVYAAFLSTVLPLLQLTHQVQLVTIALVALFAAMLVACRDRGTVGWSPRLGGNGSLAGPGSATRWRPTTSNPAARSTDSRSQPRGTCRRERSDAE